MTEGTYRVNAARFTVSVCTIPDQVPGFSRPDTAGACRGAASALML